MDGGALRVASWYYYIENGKTKGPVPGAEILKLLQEGKLQSVDTVCEEGATNWKPISAQQGLRLELEEYTLKGSVRDLWVVLIPKPPERGKGFLQLGPLTTQQVMRELHQGRVRYVDHIWQEGMLQWKKLSEVSEFSPLEARRLPKAGQPRGVRLPPAPTWTAEEMLQSVLKADPKSRSESESPSPPPQTPPEGEAQGPELVQQFLESKSVSQTSSSLRPGSPKVRRTRRGSQPQFTKRIRRHQIFFRPPLWLKVLPIGVLIGLFVAYLLWTSSPFRQDVEPLWPRPPEPEAKTDLEANQRVEPHAAPQTTLQVEPRQRATSISLRVDGLASGSPVIRVSSDASSHFLLRLRVSARAGQVENQSHIWQVHRLQRGPEDGEFLFSLRDQGLPFGRYHIRAQINDQAVERRIDWVPDPRRHRQQLLKTFKQHSLSYQQEKRRLLNLSQQLMRSVEQGRSPQGGAWVDIRRLDQDRVAGYLFPELWLELQELDEKLRRASATRAEVTNYLQRVANFSPLR